MPTIRIARVEDAARLADIAERTFREAFAAFNTPEDIDLYRRDSDSEAIQAAEIADPRSSGYMSPGLSTAVVPRTN